MVGGGVGAAVTCGAVGMVMGMWLALNDGVGWDGVGMILCCAVLCCVVFGCVEWCCVGWSRVSILQVLAGHQHGRQQGLKKVLGEQKRICCAIVKFQGEKWVADFVFLHAFFIIFVFFAPTQEGATSPLTLNCLPAVSTPSLLSPNRAASSATWDTSRHAGDPPRGTHSHGEAAAAPSSTTPSTGAIDDACPGGDTPPRGDALLRGSTPPRGDAPPGIVSSVCIPSPLIFFPLIEGTVTPATMGTPPGV